MSSDPLRDALSAGLPTAAPPPVPRTAQPRQQTGEATRATRNNNPGNIEDGPFARKQPGYKGSDGRFAIFESPEAGRGAQLSLLNGYVSRGINTPRKIASRWAPAHENDSANYAAKIAQNLGIGVDDPVPAGAATAIADMQDKLEGYHGPKAMGPVYKPDPNDPLRQVLASNDPVVVNQGNVDRGPSGSGSNGPTPPASDGGGLGQWLPGWLAPSGVREEAGAVVASSPAAEMGQGQRPVGRNPSQAAASLRTGTPQEAAAGFARGLSAPSRTVATGIEGGARYLGVDPALAKQSTDRALNSGLNAMGGTFLGPLLSALSSARPVDDSAAYKAGRFSGEMTATAPLAEWKLLGEAKAGSGELAQAIRRYANYSAQGAGAGAALSEGNNIGEQAAYGAVFGPLLGAAGEQLVGPAFGKIAQWGSDLKAALKTKLASQGEAASALPSVMPEDVQRGITDMINAGKGADEIISAFPEWAGSGKNPQTIAQWVRLRERGDTRPVNWTARPNQRPTGSGAGDVAQPPEGIGAEDIVVAAPAKAKSEHLAAAIGNRAAKQGVEATSELPPQVGEHYQRLVNQGVNPGEALREADIIGIGAKPTVATVRRTPEDMRALIEGAKSGTPEGNALSQQIADNNAAVHNKVQSLVADLGGVPAQGEAAQVAAEALARKADEARLKVSQLYEHARRLDGDQRVSVDALRELLASTPFKASTTAEGKQLVSGLRAQIKAMEAENGGRFSPDEIDQLTKSANAAFNPMGGGVNHMIGEIKTALNESLDQFNKAGPAFSKARAAHADYATKYDDPAGIAGLIRRDAKGNFLNEDNWRSAEGIVGTVGDKKFVQIVRQLREDGEQQALDRLKASIVQRAYERASNNAADRLGNATVNGKLWFAELNKIGEAKLKAVFSPSEIADLAHVGRSAIHMNEAVPGAANTSNTASAILDAMAKNGKGFTHPKLKTAGHIIGQGVGLLSNTATPGAGNAVAAALTTGASKSADAIANRSAANALAKALREQMSPDAARASEAAAAKRLADTILRKRSSRRIAETLARAAGAEENRRSQ